MTSLYCNICAARFTTNDYSVRVCSTACRGAFQRLRGKVNGVLTHGRRQVLAHLRALEPGEATSYRDLAQKLYGDTSEGSVTAVRGIVGRLRSVGGIYGLEIKVERAVFDDPFSASRISLVKDVAMPGDQAQARQDAALEQRAPLAAV